VSSIDWFAGAGNGGTVDTARLLEHNAEALHAIVAAGALLSLGLTSDGGALGVTVTVDGRWRREYFRHEDELLAWLAEAVPAVETARASVAASAVPAPAQRGRRARL
jgi:hypothetical protein